MLLVAAAAKDYSSDELSKMRNDNHNQAQKIVQGIDTVFPSISMDTDIISKLIQLLKALVIGQAAMVQVDQFSDSVPLTDMYHYQQKPSVVSMLIPIAAPDANITMDFCDGKRPSKDQIIELDPSYVATAPLFVKQFLIPQMNKLALKMEKKNDYQCKFHSISIVPIPDEVLTQDFNRYLVAIVDARMVHIEKYAITFYVHPMFLNVWNTEDTVFDQQLLEYLFKKADKMLPNKLTVGSFLELFKEMPKVVLEACQKFGMSKACAACLILLCLLVPFFWNYFFFEMATVVCSLLKLPAQTCIGIQLTSFMLAYIMIYPSSVAIFRFCKHKVCTSGIVNFLFKDAPVLSYSWTISFLKSLFQ